MIDCSAYLINVVRAVSCFPRAGWLLPLGFQLGCFAGFQPTTWICIFSFGSSLVIQQVDVFTSSLPVIVIVVTSSGSLVALRFTLKAHATCQSISTVSSGVTLDRVQPDFNLTKARLVTKKLELKAPGGRPTW